jgi:hypothetical protein
LQALNHISSKGREEEKTEEKRREEKRREEKRREKTEERLPLSRMEPEPCSSQAVASLPWTARAGRVCTVCSSRK